MKQKQNIMKPQDLVILLKIITMYSTHWQQKPLAESLKMSQSEISESLARSKYSGLIDIGLKKVNRLALMDFLIYGLAYVFPQKPGALVRGIPTAHSGPPLNLLIQSNELYVWPTAKGKARGQCIMPLYPSVVDSVENNNDFYQLLCLADAIRVGRAREKELAIIELKRLILNDVQ